MSVKTEIEGGYVRLDLRNPGDFGSIRIGSSARTEQDLNRDLETLAAAAKTRLNKFDDELGGVSIILERRRCCEHCGNDWTEDGDKYNGGCCEGDEREAEISRLDEQEAK